MKKIVFTVIIIMMSIAAVRAQSRSSLLQRINEIKSQTDSYFWDQYTHPNADTAKINATKRLLVDVNLNRSEQDKVTVAELMLHAGYITMDRGSLKQLFAYIKKDDAASLGGDMRVAAQPTQPVQVQYDSSVGTPSVTNTPPVVFNPSVKPFIPEAFVQRVMATKNFIDVYKLLKSMKSEGQILQFGKLKDVEDYSSFELILFDMQSQEIITMLSPANNMGKRTNMVSGVEDSLENYPMNMTAVIWYIK